MPENGVILDTLSARLVILKTAPSRIEKELYPAAKGILKAANPTTPIQTGRMRRSGRVVPRSRDVMIAYGGAQAPYTALVYDDPQWSHGLPPSPTGLRRWFKPAIAKRLPFLRARVVKALRGR